MRSRTSAVDVPSPWVEGLAAWADVSSAWAEGLDAWADVSSAWADVSSAWVHGWTACAEGLDAWAEGSAAWVHGWTACAEGLDAWVEGLGAWAQGRTACAGGLGAWVHGWTACAEGLGAPVHGWTACAEGLGTWVDGVVMHAALAPRSLRGRLAALDAVVKEHHLDAARAAAELVVVTADEFAKIVRDAVRVHRSREMTNVVAQVVVRAGDQANDLGGARAPGRSVVCGQHGPLVVRTAGSSEPTTPNVSGRESPTITGRARSVPEATLQRRGVQRGGCDACAPPTVDGRRQDWTHGRPSCHHLE